MVIQFINAITSFVADNAVLVGVVIVVVEHIKRLTAGLVWMKSWYITIVGFIVGFLFAIPEAGFVGIVWLDYITGGFALGLVATGLYDVLSSITAKAASTLQVKK